MSEYGGIEVFGRQPRSQRKSRPQRQSQLPRQSRRRSDPRASHRGDRWRRSRLGLLGLAAALVTAASTVTGISLALADKFEASILLAYLATGASVVAFLCGVAAVLTGRGRAWGAAAVLVGVLASPPVLTKLLGWASGLG